MSLHSHTGFLCRRGFPEINPPQVCASSSRTDWPGGAGRLARVQFQRRFRRLCATTPFGLRWDRRRRLVVANATQKGGGAGREINLDDVDLMTLEFGRLLGEPKDKTLSKVVRRKLEPNATYIGLEKVARKGDNSKPLSKSDLVNYQIHLDKPKRVDADRKNTVGSATSELPYLASPPVRQNGAVGKDSQPAQLDSKSAASSTRRLQMEANESVDESLLRKPSLSKRSTDEMAMVLPTVKVVSPVFMRMKMQTVESLAKKSDADDDLLRKPFVRHANKARYKSTNELNENLKDQDLALNASAHEPLLQKPSVDQRPTDSMAAELPTENARPSLSRSMKRQTMESSGKESSADDDLLRRPSMRNVNKTSSASTNGHYRNLMDNKLVLNVRAADSHPENLRVRQNEEKPSLPMSQPEILPDLQDNKTIEGSEFEYDDILDKSSLQIPEKVVFSESPKQMCADDESTQMLNVGVPEQDALISAFRQPVDEEPFITVPKQEEQLGEEGPLVEATAFLDAGAHNKLQMRLSRPKPSNHLANGSQSRHVSIATSQSKVQNVRVEKVSAPRRPGKVPSVHREEVTAFENTRFKSDIQSESAQMIELDLEASPESNLNRVAGPRVENKLARQVDSSGERVVEDLDIPNTSEGNSVASLVMQDLRSAMSSEEHESKQQLLNLVQGKAVLNGVSIDSVEDTSAAEEVLNNTVEQATKTLRRPAQSPVVKTVWPQLPIIDLGTADFKGHQIKEDEESDWIRAEALLKSKEQVEVTVIGGNSATLIVSFGSLLGFIPQFELSPKRGFLEFPSWAQQKGFNVTWRKGLKNGGVGDIDHLDTAVRKNGNDKVIIATEGDIKDLRSKYNEEIISSFVGKKARVIVKSVDKNERRLKFSERETDPDIREVVQKKADLMAELKVGDVVSCEVRSITPIGVFVELDGVLALIHHSEVSWNAGVDPASLLSVGEAIKARVCRLDRTLQRINLSLKQMQPDPLMETLESVVGDLEGETSFNESHVTEFEVVEWPELEALIIKIEQMEEITCVSKGRCLRSAALAPAFQVFLSTPQDGGYKLLARLGNKIQEVLVDTTLDRDKMKESIRMCTFTES